MKLCTVFEGEKNKTNKWIAKEAKPRIGRRFGCSVEEEFCMFLNG
jgi:hypothetical protein